MRKAFRYIVVHEDMPDHPKVEPLSDAAFRLLVTSWAWCRKHKTDGVMPTNVWTKRRTSKIRAELTSAGLVHVEGNEVRFHDYLDWQKSNDEIEALSAKRRTSGQAGGLAKARAVASGLLSKSVPEGEGEGEKNKAADAAPPRTDVERLCRYFLDSVTRNGVRAAITERWRTEARLLLDRDGRDRDEIRRVIDWCAQDSFWKSNIHSLPTLRAKYDRLRLAMERDKPEHTEGNPHTAWAREQG
jgi:hypothetical protein